MEMGLSFSEIKELTDDEYIMILATKIAIRLNIYIKLWDILSHIDITH